jgi:protein-S-isoprenylcysteine O-methyltransferase Ste14
LYLDILTSLLATIIIGTHIWAMRNHFNMQEDVPPGTRLISALVILSAVFLAWLTWVNTQPVTAQLVGFAALVASYGLYWMTIRESQSAKLLSAFDERMPHGLLKTGPYKYVRHPFYTSYLLLWGGWAIATWNIWSLVPVSGMIATYWAATNDEEGKFATTPMAEEYAEYASKTGRFFPKLFGRF